MIHFDNVGKAYKSRKDRGEVVWPIRNFSATIVNGESTAILVPEGGGKTTLIDLVAGSELLTEGSITRGGHISWPASYRGIISAKMTGKQNLRFLTDCYGRNFAAAYEFLQEFSELGRYVDLPVRQYSNEQRHRLALTSLLAMNFEFILIDDAFEAGESSFRRRTAEYVKDNSDSITFFMATGNTRLVERYCQRAGILSEGTVTFYPSVAEAIEAFGKINDAEY
ncbi:ABC transporter ATP-binding protein [Rhizobium sp. TH2]|uniref:ATP-binding cassette domain-containing protein n=1 Tax=Rhizobium sp. TH2 TaxID=2775403 RepID=UPI002157B176|nr:ATP-binding cassette domain-containing protein [Rhizobium sp. TH2]UVC10246.1 ABC transporter ATP-binding protein [Rhizobium sp. TH2]